MKKLLPLFGVILCTLVQISGKAQCSAGSSRATINWDNLDYLAKNGNYRSFISNSMVQSQHFALGVNMLSIDFPYGAVMSTNGENGSNTAEAGSYGAGEDVEYSGNGLLSFNFASPVFNLEFSLYDIDQAQSVRVQAFDNSGTPVALPVYMSLLQSGILGITGSGTSTATATASNGACGNNDRRGTLNLRIPGGTSGIISVQINISGGTGSGADFWLSDISACVTGAFPLNYYASEKPYQGQPSYYMVTPDNNGVYLFNPETGVADWIFGEPSSPWVNSMAYDPVNKILYYVSDNPSPVMGNRSLKKYDFNTEMQSTVVADISTLGIPLYEIVIESGGAAFYNGSLFLGIEGTNNGKNSGRESAIWRIDFDASQIPYRACQVMALPADDGRGNLTHDWGDFTIKDGILYDFNSGNSGSTSRFVHYDMQNGTATNFSPFGNPVPVQAGQTWDGKLYWTGGQGNETGKVARYLENGTIGAKRSVSVTSCSPRWVGKAGDASDPIRPKVDFGDAPASYDPIADDRATHEYDCNLRLGATFDREWTKTASIQADGDGPDEDGILNAMFLANGLTSFVQDVQVFNNTGVNATLGAWLDFNMNGQFDAGEATMLTVPSRRGMQTLTLAWPMLNIALPVGSKLYLRVRITSAQNGMTANDATGWMANGEVEDYPVSVESVLPVKLVSFTATEQGDNTILQWSAVNEDGVIHYIVQESENGIDWFDVEQVNPKKLGAGSNYSSSTKMKVRAYYRILVRETNRVHYSEVIQTKMESTERTQSSACFIAQQRINVGMFCVEKEALHWQLLSGTGERIAEGKKALSAGSARFEIELNKPIPNGVYLLHIRSEKRDETLRITLVR